MIKRFIVGFLAFCCSGITLAYIVDGSRIHRPKLLSYVKEQLQNYGVVTQSKDGFTYVKLSQEYIADLIQQSRQPDFNLPSYKTEDLNSEARINIIASHEAKNIKQVQELGTTIHFKPLGFYTIIDHDKEYFMLAVDAPELSSMRVKYGLSEKLANHAFTITIGVRQLTAENELES